MREDLVSIIMAAYNAADSIEEAIRSVLSQTYENWELIVVNDGSTDATEERIRSIKDPRIRYLKISNSGVSTARNQGLEIMKGSYFCFLDSDDALPRNSINARSEKLRANKQLAFVDGPLVHMDARLEKELWVQRPSFRGAPFEELVRITGSCFSGPTWMFRRETDKEYRFADGLTHSEDLLFYIHNADQGLYDFVEEPVLHYREGNVSAMSNIDGSKKGYELVHADLCQRYLPDHKGLIQAYEAKTRSIIVKSYLRDMKPLKALQALLMYR